MATSLDCVISTNQLIYSVLILFPPAAVKQLHLHRFSMFNSFLLSFYQYTLRGREKNQSAHVPRLCFDNSFRCLCFVTFLERSTQNRSKNKPSPTLTSLITNKSRLRYTRRHLAVDGRNPV